MNNKGPIETFYETNAWTKHKYARNKDGDACGIHDEEACKFCIQGAAEKLKLGFSYVVKIEEIVRKELATQLNKLSPLMPMFPVAYFNDNVLQTKEELVEWLRKYNL